MKCHKGFNGECDQIPKTDSYKPSDLSDLLDRAFVILGDIVDENECNYDHHGNCQEHGWSNPAEEWASMEDVPCPHKRAKKWLTEMGEIKAG